MISFDTLDECVEACGTLLEDRAARDDMREANHDYYFRLRPSVVACASCCRQTGLVGQIAPKRLAMSVADGLS